MGVGGLLRGAAARRLKAQGLAKSLCESCNPFNPQRSSWNSRFFSSTQPRSNLGHFESNTTIRRLNISLFSGNTLSHSLCGATPCVVRGYSSEVPIKRGVASRLALINRQDQKNALTAAMLERLRKLVAKWENEDDVRMVILQGAGGAFSSGVDVKMLCSLVSEGKVDECKTIFQNMYHLNYMLGSYKKINVAIMDGPVIGGAYGLCSNADFRIATERAMFSVPETHIGFHPDGGGSYFLSRLKGSIGEYLALTGEQLDMSDMFRIGLATLPVNRKDLDEVLFQLHSLETDDLDVVEHILAPFENDIRTDPDSFISRLDAINRCFRMETVEDIIYALESQAEGPDIAWYTDVLDSMRAASPISQKIALRSIREARSGTLSECLKREYRLSIRMISGGLSPDFLEGVRARFITKQGKAKWNPPNLDLVTPEMVDAYFQPLEEGEELQLSADDHRGRGVVGGTVKQEEDILDWATRTAKM